MVLITLILSYFTLIFGELVPKRVAMKEPEAVARAVCGVISVTAKATKPVVWLLTKSVNGVLRLFGIDPAATEEEVTEDEIRMMVDMGEEKGAIEGNERDMIENIFEFNNMTAADCMTHRTDVTALQVDATNKEIMKVIAESGLSRFPVYGEDLDDVLGTFTTRDYLLALSTGGKKTLREILRPAYFVPESVRTDVLFRDMQKKKTHIAIVVDEFGGTLGLVTMEDILEELVGDIWDESDEIVEECVRTGENTYEVNGDMNIDDFFAEIEFEPRDFECEYSTVGGWAIEMLEADPHVGDSFSYRDIPAEDGEEDDPEEPATTLTVVVSAMDDMRVTKLTVLVTRPAAEREEEE